jgi:hypothetical protein
MSSSRLKRSHEQHGHAVSTFAGREYKKPARDVVVVGALKAAAVLQVHQHEVLVANHRSTAIAMGVYSVAIEPASLTECCRSPWIGPSGPFTRISLATRGATARTNAKRGTGSPRGSQESSRPR